MPQSRRYIVVQCRNKPSFGRLCFLANLYNKLSENDQRSILKEIREIAGSRPRTDPTKPFNLSFGEEYLCVQRSRLYSIAHRWSLLTEEEHKSINAKIESLLATPGNKEI